MKEIILAALLSSLPLTETRLALPVALFGLKLSPMIAFVSTLIGNLLPMPFIFFLLRPAIAMIHQWIPWLDNKFIHWQHIQEKKHGASYSKWGALFLFILVVIPGPGTGVWTASVLAVLFRINLRLAAVAITAGAFVAGLVILGVALGIFSGIQLL